MRYGAERVVLVDDEALAEYHPETTPRRSAASSSRRGRTRLILDGEGRDYGPRVAGELELGMTGDCVDLGIDKAGRLIQYKPAYGGNIVSVIMGATTRSSPR